MFRYSLDVHFMPHISAADKAAEEALGENMTPLKRAEKMWRDLKEAAQGAEDGGGQVSGGDRSSPGTLRNFDLWS
jgi:hypothetical protein